MCANEEEHLGRLHTPRPTPHQVNVLDSSERSLSSGESEYYALHRSSAHATGIKAMLNDWRFGVECEIRMAIAVLQGACLLDKDW